MSPPRKVKKSLTPDEVERNAVRELVKAARARGEDLTGPDGLLKSITKQVIEAALEEEMTEHVGYDKHAVQGRNGGNSRNGTRAKPVLTDNAGPVHVEVPRDRDGSFEPVIVKKRQRRLTDVDAVACKSPTEPDGRVPCWCCGSIDPPDRMVHLGDHPEVVLCLQCAHLVHQQAWEIEDLGNHGPAAFARDQFRNLRAQVIHRGWWHRNKLIGGKLRWLGKYLP